MVQCRKHGERDARVVGALPRDVRRCFLSTPTRARCAPLVARSGDATNGAARATSESAYGSRHSAIPTSARAGVCMERQLAAGEYLALVSPNRPSCQAAKRRGEEGEAKHATASALAGAAPRGRVHAPTRRECEPSHSVAQLGVCRASGPKRRREDAPRIASLAAGADPQLTRQPSATMTGTRAIK